MQRLKWRLTRKCCRGTLQKLSNTLSVSKGGLEQSCLQIPAKRLQWRLRWQKGVSSILRGQNMLKNLVPETCTSVLHQKLDGRSRKLLTTNTEIWQTTPAENSRRPTKPHNFGHMHRTSLCTEKASARKHHDTCSKNLYKTLKHVSSL